MVIAEVLSPPPPPPVTQWSDALYLILLSIPLALVAHLLLISPSLRKGLKAEAETGSGVPGSQGLVVAEKRFRWTGLSLLLSWLPILAMVLGNIGCSLLRDAGFKIFPWPLIGVAVLFGVTGALCHTVRWRIIRKTADTEAKET